MALYPAVEMYSPRVISSASGRNGSSIPYESPIRGRRTASGDARSVRSTPRRTSSYANSPRVAAADGLAARVSPRPSPGAMAARYLPSPTPPLFSPRGHGLAATSSGSTRVKELMAAASSIDRSRALHDARMRTIQMQQELEIQRNAELARQIRNEAAARAADDLMSKVTQPDPFADGASDAGAALSGAHDVSRLGPASEDAHTYGLEGGIELLPAARPGQVYFSPLRRTLSGVVSTSARTATVDTYLSPRPEPEPEPELESAAGPPAPLRDQWLVAMDSARDIEHLDPAAKADRLLGLQKRAWEQASALAEVIASPKVVEDEPPPEDRYSKLDELDRKAVDSLGWTPETFNDGRGPSVQWETLSEEERRMAMMIGYDGEAWDEAVKEQQEEDEQRQAEIEANDPVRHARAAKDVDMFLMELASSVTPR